MSIQPTAPAPQPTEAYYGPTINELETRRRSIATHMGVNGLLATADLGLAASYALQHETPYNIVSAGWTIAAAAAIGSIYFQSRAYNAIDEQLTLAKANPNTPKGPSLSELNERHREESRFLAGSLAVAANLGVGTVGALAYETPVNPVSIVSAVGAAAGTYYLWQKNRRAKAIEQQMDAMSTPRGGVSNIPTTQYREQTPATTRPVRPRLGGQAGRIAQQAFDRRLAG